MMCRELTTELAHFDLRKEHELKQVFQEFAAAQLEKHEKVTTPHHSVLCYSTPPSLQYQGKWYAMRCMLDAPINPLLRAIQFVSDQPTPGEPIPTVHCSSCQYLTSL